MSVALAKESDAGLLLLLGAAGGSPADQKIAHAALDELFKRHYGYVRSILKQYAENVGTVVIDPSEFAIATFKKAARSACNFEDQSDGNYDEARRQVRAWLGKVAANLARDELRRLTRHQADLPLVLLDEAPDVANDSDAVSDTTPTDERRREAVREAMDRLKPEERDIVTTYVNFGTPTSSGGLELPDEERTALQRRTGYERDTLRQKKRRLFQQLRQILDTKSPE